MSDVLRESTTQDGAFYSWLFFCPGCRIVHSIDTRWTFDGNHEAPTFSPSLLTQWPAGSLLHRCHLFIKAGTIDFLSDCDHHLAGQTVPMEPFRWDFEDRHEDGDGE